MAYLAWVGIHAGGHQFLCCARVVALQSEWFSPPGNHKDGPGRLHAAQRRIALDQLHNCGTQTPQIGPLVVCGSVYALWSHPVRRPDEGRTRTHAQGTSHAKVAQPNTAVL